MRFSAKKELGGEKHWKEKAEIQSVNIQRKPVVPVTRWKDALNKIKLKLRATRILWNHLLSLIQKGLMDVENKHADRYRLTNEHKRSIMRFPLAYMQICKNS